MNLNNVQNVENNIKSSTDLNEERKAPNRKPPIEHHFKDVGKE